MNVSLWQTELERFPARSEKTAGREDKHSLCWVWENQEGNRLIEFVQERNKPVVELFALGHYGVSSEK